MKKILLVGCGKLGSALLEGALGSGFSSSQMVVIAPRRAQEISERFGVQAFASIADISTREFDCVVLAVKPQIMSSVLQEIRAAFSAEALSGLCVLSVAAGKTLKFFADALGETIPVVRAMPNLPAIVGSGITGVIANAYVSDSMRADIDQLMRAIGVVEWIKNEAWMDAITAISGSGPAYVCYFLECLQKAAEKLGLPLELAQSFSEVTLFGTAQLLKEKSLSPSELREQVTSPNGTTAAALDVLMRGAFEEALIEAVRAANFRGQELAK